MVDVLEEVAPVETATTVEAALSRLKAKGLGLVVADLHFGRNRMDGVRVIEEAVRQQLPVIVCSGSTNGEVREALGPLKPDAIVMKPFQIDEVLELASRLLRK